MGFSMELVNAKRRIKALEGELQVLNKRLSPPSAPTINGLINANDLMQLYLEIFPQAGNKIFIADSMYRITAISEIRRFIDWDDTNIFAYTAEVKDCDDFALALAGDFAKYPEWSGYPVTFIWGSLLGGHAFATCVAWKSLEERIPTVYFIEPQDDHEIARELVEDMELWLLPI